MKQAILEKPQKIVFREVEKPKVSGREVLVKVERIGICGSDIKAYYGKHPYIACPIVQGHEFSGVVADMGRQVKNLKINDRVTVRPQLVCGRCRLCKQGDYNICENLKVIGCQAEGAAQEFLKVDSSLVVKLPEKMSFEEGAMVEPVAVAVHAVERATHIKGGKGPGSGSRNHRQPDSSGGQGYGSRGSNDHRPKQFPVENCQGMRSEICG